MRICWLVKEFVIEILWNMTPNNLMTKITIMEFSSEGWDVSTSIEVTQLFGDGSPEYIQLCVSAFVTGVMLLLLSGPLYMYNVYYIIMENKT